jgi:hypothetical protein
MGCHVHEPTPCTLCEKIKLQVGIPPHLLMRNLLRLLESGKLTATFQSDKGTVEYVIHVEDPTTSATLKLVERYPHAHPAPTHKL